jgi:hypothetical protein
VQAENELQGRMVHECVHESNFIRPGNAKHIFHARRFERAQHQIAARAFHCLGGLHADRRGLLPLGHRGLLIRAHTLLSFAEIVS